MTIQINRRTWLQGAAGFTLALPFLSSLTPRSAKAGPTPRIKRFIALGVDHGALRQSNMHPAESTLTQTLDYAPHQVRRGDLSLQVQGGIASLSPVLSASSSVLTPTLAKKLNVLRGLDVTFYMGHNRGGHLGNFGDNDGNLNGEQGIALRPTIDQVLAWSKTFYPSLDGIKERSLVPGVYYGDYKMSWGYANPSTQSGEVQAITPEFDSLTLFNKIFVAPADPTDQRPPVIDRVLEDYKRLRNGNRRLSTSDKQRLDDYVARIDELQRKLKVQSKCTNVQVPTTSNQKVREADPSFGVNPETQAKAWQLVNDVIVAAFACDTSRIATMRIGDTEIFSTFAGDWHHQIAHEAEPLDSLGQTTMRDSRQKIFEHVFLDLATKLDAIEETEGTLLDNTLLQWTQEAGPSTHTPIELPVVTAGSAAGFFKTGQHVDYRDLNLQVAQESPEKLGLHIGLVYNQWLGTVLQSMGLSPSEYEKDGHGGYGAIKMATEGWYPGTNRYDAKKLAVMGEVLPFLMA